MEQEVKKVSEYKMSEIMIKELLKARKGDELKMNKDEYLCYWVNKQIGLKYPCVKVIPF